MFQAARQLHKQTITSYKQEEASYGLDKVKGHIIQVSTMQLQPQYSYMIKYDMYFYSYWPRSTIKHEIIKERLSNKGMIMQLARWLSPLIKSGIL